MNLNLFFLICKWNELLGVLTHVLLLCHTLFKPLTTLYYPGSNKLTGPNELSKCVKLIDEHNQWCESASDVSETDSWLLLSSMLMPTVLMIH